MPQTTIKNSKVNSLHRHWLMGLLLTLLISCGGGNSSSTSDSFDSEEGSNEQTEDNNQSAPPANPDSPAITQPQPESPPTADEIARQICKDAKNLTPEFTRCELENFTRASESTLQQATDLNFLSRWQTQSANNLQNFLERSATDLFWNSLGNLCATYVEQCTGDPYRYADVPDDEATAGSRFYDHAQVIPINFYDQEGARLSGRIWAPKERAEGQKFPAVMILNGSVQAPETTYWWGAQLLVKHGYIVMTFDVRAQGRSDTFTPDLQTGSNVDPTVFRTNLIDAIDFLYSTPEQLYPHNLPGSLGFVSDLGLAKTTSHNPLHHWLDRDRLGAIGHSLGAIGVSVVQGEQPWPGELLTDNPIDAIVAWDNLMLDDSLDGVEVTPRVPAMGQAGDYFLAPVPNVSKPDPLQKSRGFFNWQAANVDSMQINIRSATHYEWSLLPTFPTTAWTGGLIIDSQSADQAPGWAQPMAQYYTLAWMDRWLKIAGESGFEDADQRLLDLRPWRTRFSFYYDSQLDFRDRQGKRHTCDDLAAPCL